jgi:hypothetical protein
MVLFRNETFIYQLIYRILMHRSSYERSPTLSTVLMVEKEIDRHSGEFNQTQLWKALPKKVMWQTYLVVLDYLESINKIAFDKQGTIAYIWNPGLARKLRARKEIKA